MFGVWGNNKEKQNIITAEAIKAQASSNVKNLQNKADDLRQEISELESRLTNIQPEIDKAYKARDSKHLQKEKEISQKLSELDGKESRLSIRVKNLIEGEKTLKSDQEGFRKLIESKEQANEKTRRDLIIDRESLESVRKTLHEAVAMYRMRINEVDVLSADIRDDRKTLEQDKAAWAAQEKDLSDRESKLIEKETILNTKRFMLDKKEKELKDLETSVSISKKECDEAIDKQKEIESRNRQSLALIAVKENDLIASAQSQTDERNQLNVFKKTLENKENALQKRESNLRQLEATK